MYRVTAPQHCGATGLVGFEGNSKRAAIFWLKTSLAGFIHSGENSNGGKGRRSLLVRVGGEFMRSRLLAGGAGYIGSHAANHWPGRVCFGQNGRFHAGVDDHLTLAGRFCSRGVGENGGSLSQVVSLVCRKFRKCPMSGRPYGLSRLLLPECPVRGGLPGRAAGSAGGRPGTWPRNPESGTWS